MKSLRLKALLAKLCMHSIQTKDFTFTGRKTIPGNGYLRIATAAETGLSSYTVIGAVITTWDSNSGAITLAMGGDNAIWIFGPSGAYVEGLKVRISYVGAI